MHGHSNYWESLKSVLTIFHECGEFFLREADIITCVQYIKN
jgi:hypothetical protein